MSMPTARIQPPAPTGSRPDRLSHLLLQTPRFEAMVSWYKTVLNASPMFENEVVCFMSYDEEHHRMVLLNKPDAEPHDPQAAGIGHFAFAFDNLGDLLAHYARLKDQHAIEPAYCVNHGFMTSFYYKDPDGNELELGVNNFEDNAAIDEWFATGAFDANFFGFVCDPAYMLRRHREQASDAVIFAETYQ